MWFLKASQVARGIFGLSWMTGAVFCLSMLASIILCWKCLFCIIRIYNHFTSRPEQFTWTIFAPQCLTSCFPTCPNLVIDTASYWPATSWWEALDQWARRTQFQHFHFSDISVPESCAHFTTIYLLTLWWEQQNLVGLSERSGVRGCGRGRGWRTENSLTK